MINKVVIFLCSICLSITGICQGNRVKHSFHALHNAKEYFKLLFGENGSINLPYQVVKVGIKKQPFFLITSKEEFKNFFKFKYNITDSAAEEKELLFLQGNNKIAFSDTVFLIKNTQLRRMDIHHDSILYKYRRLNLLDFLNKYCPIPQFEQNIYVLAYMFEKRMLYDWNNQRIDFKTASLLASKYNIQWNPNKNIWYQILDSNSKEKTPPK